VKFDSMATDLIQVIFGIPEIDFVLDLIVRRWLWVVLYYLGKLPGILLLLHGTYLLLVNLLQPVEKLAAGHHLASG
jgi:hypothetical protein